MDFQARWKLRQTRDRKQVVADTLDTDVEHVAAGVEKYKAPKAG